ncbi:VOC family protein [Streptomyces sp. GS7]|uniref:VOC family protein n=1 Tax=Streptomyces sp. GS7 TaxID=2692234 RepID=UPI0013196BD4|nr:VOC family protein [Streptomyces sp. GS7]QHC22863.1 VOC family protein [Streptomyces sp. GS7]
MGNKDVIVNCRDLERLAAFWSVVLGRPIVARTGPFVWLARAGGPGLGLQRVEGPKSGKNRVHFHVSAPDPAAAQRRIEARGGLRLQEFAGSGFLVMADPEGNEFCVIPPGPFDVDGQGRADYLIA